MGKYDDKKGVTSIADFSKLVYGGVPPQNVELEQIVLGAAMLDAAAPEKLSTLVSVETFYDARHGDIFQAIKTLSAQRRPVDLVTVRAELMRVGKIETVPTTYLVELTNKVASSANLEYYCAMLRQLQIRRTCITVSAKATADAYDDGVDPIDLISRYTGELSGLTKELQRKKSERAADVVTAELARMLKVSELEGILGLGTGLSDLDALTNGMQAPDLITLAARPAMGKTALALTIAVYVAVVLKKPVGIFSLEMSAEQLIRRAMALVAGIPVIALTDPRKLTEYQWRQLDDAADVLRNCQIVINDTAGISQAEVTTEARRMVNEEGVEFIVLDYLQLMTNPALGPYANKERIVGENSANNKALAKELNVPFMQLAQLSRAVETRGGHKRPTLSDLRDSGQIEQDSDIVAFLYRPEYYGIEEDGDGASTKGLAELIIAKHRNGPTDTVRLKFVDYLTKFTDWEDLDFADLPSDSQPVSSAASQLDEDLPF